MSRMFSIDLEGHAPSWPRALCYRTRPQRVAVIWLQARLAL